MPFGLLLIATYCTSYVGAYFYTSAATFPGYIWPAAGITMAGLVLGGRKLWPAITIGSFLASLTVGTPALSAVFLALSYTLCAISGAWIIDRFRFNFLLSRLQDAIVLLVAALIPTTIVPTVAALNRILIRENATWAQFSDIWGALWVGQIVSVIVLTPFIIRWLTRYYFKRTFAEIVELAAAFSLLILVDLVLFWTPYTVYYGVPLAYFIFVPFIWIALRIGPRFMTVAILFNASFALGGAISGISGQFTGDLGQRLFQAEIQIIIISFIFLVLASIAEERKDISRDLSKQVVRLRAANQRIREDGKTKNQFIAILAHELRNPLAPIVSSLELIRMEGTPEKSARWIDTIESHTHTMRRLLDDFLDVARITERKFRLEKEVTDLRAVIELALSSATPMIESRQHTVVYEAPIIPIMADIDPTRIQQAVVNLLNNAARYTEPGGTITVTLAPRGDVACISVADTGMGISPEMRSRIFDPFVQAKTGRAGTQGLGIGLSLVKEIVGMHDGIIEAVSEGLGLGSEFIICLPLARTMDTITLTETPMTSLPLVASSVSSRRVLIVDDNEAAAEGLGKLLEYRGHKVRLAYTGAEALAAVAEEAPEVLVLDIGLPDQDGYEVARTLRGKLKFTGTLIALTGYGQYEDREIAKEAGFDHHLTKPVGLREMETVLAKLA